MAGISKHRFRTTETVTDKPGRLRVTIHAMPLFSPEHELDGRPIDQ